MTNWYVFTNRNNLNEILSGGCLRTSDSFTKYYRDLSTHFPGRILLFNRPADISWLQELSESITSFPVALEFDLSNVPVNRLPHPFDVEADDGSRVDCLAINGPLSLQHCRGIWFQDERLKTEFLARQYMNVPRPEHLVKVGSGAKNPFRLNLDKIAGLDFPSSPLSWKCLDRCKGVLVILHRFACEGVLSSPPLLRMLTRFHRGVDGSEWIESEKLIRCSKAISEDHMDLRFDLLPWFFSAPPHNRWEKLISRLEKSHKLKKALSPTARIELILWLAAAEAAADSDANNPDCLSIMDGVVAALPARMAASGLDAVSEDWQKSFEQASSLARAILDSTADMAESPSIAEKMPALIPLLLFCNRLDLEDALQWKRDGTKYGFAQEAINGACVLATLRCGYSRMSREFKNPVGLLDDAMDSGNAQLGGGIGAAYGPLDLKIELIESENEYARIETTRCGIFGSAFETSRINWMDDLSTRLAALKRFPGDSPVILSFVEAVGWTDCLLYRVSVANGRVTGAGKDRVLILSEPPVVENIVNGQALRDRLTAGTPAINWKKIPLSLKKKLESLCGPTIPPKRAERRGGNRTKMAAIPIESVKDTSAS